MKDSRVKNAFIMAAGYGTRLEPLTLAVPKPMVPIVNKPTMQHNIELLRKHGIREVVANIHYHPEQITNYFGDGNEFGVDLSFSYEEKLMGTAGGVLKMAKLHKKTNETFIVLSSDALTDINLRHMIEFHKKKKAIATMALCPIDEVEHFGVVELDQDDQVLEFKEKPKKQDVKSNLVNAGIYIFEPEILDMIPDGKFYDFGKELFPRLVKDKARIFGYKMIEYWSDVGNIQAYMRANYDAMRGTVRVQVPGKKLSSCVWIGKNVVIDPSAKFEGCVILGDRCEVRGNAVIKDSVIGNMSVVDTNANVEGSIIWSDSLIFKNAEILNSVVGNWCKVEEGAQIGSNCVLSNRTQVKKNTSVSANTLLKPHQIL